MQIYRKKLDSNTNTLELFATQTEMHKKSRMFHVADAEVVELGYIEGTFGPGLVVVEVANMVTTAPADIIQSRVLANYPQHLVPTRPIEGISSQRMFQFVVRCVRFVI